MASGKLDPYENDETGFVRQCKYKAIISYKLNDKKTFVDLILFSSDAV